MQHDDHFRLIEILHCRLPGMRGRQLNLQQLVRDPAHIFLSRLKAYAMHTSALLDEAEGDPDSAAAKRAQELACEVVAIIVAKAGRVCVSRPSPSLSASASVGHADTAFAGRFQTQPVGVMQNQEGPPSGSMLAS